MIAVTLDRLKPLLPPQPTNRKGFTQGFRLKAIYTQEHPYVFNYTKSLEICKRTGAYFLVAVHRVTNKERPAINTHYQRKLRITVGPVMHAEGLWEILTQPDHPFTHPGSEPRTLTLTSYRDKPAYCSVCVFALMSVSSGPDFLQYKTRKPQ